MRDPETTRLRIGLSPKLNEGENSLSGELRESSESEKVARRVLSLLSPFVVSNKAETVGDSNTNASLAASQSPALGDRIFFHSKAVNPVLSHLCSIACGKVKNDER